MRFDPRKADLLRCPACGGGLSCVTSPTDATVVELACVECAARHRVVNGIPRFVPAENYASSFGFQWNRHYRTQLDSYTGVPISRDRLLEATGWQGPQTGRLVLEAGSGAGRFTEVLLQSGAEVVSIDYSSAVDANARNNGASDRLLLVQADMRHIPCEPGSFDTVICLGVLQHTPDPAESFASLARFVKPGGELVIDSYRNSALDMIHWRFLARPFTRGMEPERLYRLVERMAPKLVPVSAGLKKVVGGVATRVVPIAEFSEYGLSRQVNLEWAILDTFDMLSPAYDFPQTMDSVRRWYARAGFVDVKVRRGINGIVARGLAPAG